MNGRSAGWLAFVLAGGLLAQDDVGALLARLRDPKTLEPTLEAQARRGAAAVPLLVAALQRARQEDDEAAAMMVVFALGKMGAAAAPATPVLAECLESSGLPLQRQALWALGEMGQAAPRASPSLPNQLAAVGERTRSDPRAAMELAQELAILNAVLELGEAPTDGLLWATLANGPPTDRIAVGRFLAERGSEDETTRAALRQAHDAAFEAWGQQGASRLRPALELSRAMLRCCRDRPSQIRAHIVLLFHFDPEIRFHSALALRDMGEAEPTALYPLYCALSDGSPRVVRTTLQALASYGDDALFVLAELESWQSSKSETLVREGQVAAEQIRARLTPMARDVDAFFAGRQNAKELVARGKDAADPVATVLWQRTWPRTEGETVKAAIALLVELGQDSESVRRALNTHMRSTEGDVVAAARGAWQRLARN